MAHGQEGLDYSIKNIGSKKKNTCLHLNTLVVPYDNSVAQRCNSRRIADDTILVQALSELFVCGRFLGILATSLYILIIRIIGSERLLVGLNLPNTGITKLYLPFRFVLLPTYCRAY